jgi:hypothetical protein
LQDPYKETFLFGTWNFAFEIFADTDNSVVRAERQSRQTVLIEEIGPGMLLRPGITDEGGFRHLITRYYNCVSNYHSIRPDKLPIFPGKRKTLQLALP